MNIDQITAYVRQNLLGILQLQFFITLVSLPILTAWGLPLSLYSPLGNVLFVPFITVFLVVASLIFFLELLYLPNGLLIWILEQTTSWWLWCMQLGGKGWLIGFPQTMLPFMVFIAVVAIIITIHPKIKEPQQYIAAYLLLLLLCFGGRIYFQSKSPQELIVNYKKKSLMVINNRSGLTIVDQHGALGSNISVHSWIEYTLLSTLNKTFGTTYVEHLVIPKPGIVMFEAITTLSKRVYIKNLHLILWQGESPPALLRAYGGMRRALAQQQTYLHRIGHKTRLVFQPQHNIVLEPTGKTSSYKTVTYQQLAMYSQAANTWIS